MSGVKQHDTHKLAVARGSVANMFTTHRYGTNPDVGTSEETIWTHGGIRPYLTSLQTLSIVSTSANDSAAGTGLRTFLLEGLDDNFVEVSEIVTMNGTTPVLSANQYQYINRMLNLTSGSSGVNEGTINVSVGGTVYSSMLAGAGRNETAAYTVPAGKNAYITNLTMTVGAGKDARISSYFRDANGTYFRVESKFIYQTALQLILPDNPRVPSTVTFENRGQLISGSAANISVGFDLVVVTE